MPRIYTPLSFPATLDAAAVDALSVFRLPGWYLGPPGMGCFLDAPGYPTYFLRPVYNRHGNSPANAPDGVLLGSDGELRRVEVTYKYDIAAHKSSDNREQLLRSLYKPLPVDHPRVQAWIAATMAHLAHCYVDVERPEYGRPGTLVYPVPGYKLKTFRDDVRWSEEYRTAARSEADAFNKQETERAAAIATIDNHRGVRTIREVYPSWSPRDVALLGGVPGYTPADWWTTEDERPPPERCSGDPGVRSAHTEQHCQWCGMHDGVVWSPPEGGL